MLHIFQRELLKKKKKKCFITSLSFILKCTSYPFRLTPFKNTRLQIRKSSRYLLRWIQYFEGASHTKHTHSRQQGISYPVDHQLADSCLWQPEGEIFWQHHLSDVYTETIKCFGSCICLTDSADHPLNCCLWFSLKCYLFPSFILGLNHVLSSLHSFGSVHIWNDSFEHSDLWLHTLISPSLTVQPYFLHFEQLTWLANWIIIIVLPCCFIIGDVGV